MRRNRFVVMLLFAVGCSSGGPTPVVRVSDYLPLHLGAFQIYDVDSVVISQNVETAYAYELKTVITDSFPNSAGGFTYVQERFKRMSLSTPWVSIPSWSARSDGFQATVNEGNVSYVRVLSPMSNGKSWDGNAMNILGGTEKCLDSDKHTCDLYVIQDFAKPFATSTETFVNSITVIESDNEDLIVAQDRRKEIYALNVGLVYREMTKLEFCTEQACLGTQFVKSGLKYKQTIKEHGEN